MEKLTAGIIAIPIYCESQLNPKPNFFIIEKIGGITEVDFLNPIPNEKQKILASICQYKVVFRELLEATQTQPKEWTERVFIDESIYIPVDIIPLISSFERLKENKEIVNTIFSRFSFRGSMSFTTIELNESELDNIIFEKNNIVPVNLMDAQ
ncbi:hypothetical protein [Flectobacillus sp. BAB-3569]|uniref:hypothetical protein n=1 Tax=Flectobacillus sp. BAB-3569 TaxID=1509483 RepID=UPI000BA4B073|nr:hypothetical protein [Flectobacillus sp. BAB-3569]PAC29236.1 hypothetical protein BWI92_16540 [Flectobacillus sp. BAB-3569]